MIPAIQILESLTIVAPLGLRFCDVVTGSFVSDGLTVTVHEPGNAAIKRPAVANNSGVYVVHHAPGLRAFESGKGDAEFWNNVTVKKSFVIAVNDSERRYQPFQFTADLPVRGVFNWIGPPGLSPLEVACGIPLFSSPVRSVPAGMAVLRADLWDATNDIPAAWAVLEAYVDSRLAARGIADQQGRIALIFPQPAPPRFKILSPLVGSPPTPSGPPLTGHVWPISLRALYTPMGPLPQIQGEFGTETQLPDLGDILTQRDATLWADSERTEPLREGSLRYGRELILKSRPPITLSPPATQSVLFITPAVSPP